MTETGIHSKKLSVLGTSADHLGPSATSGDHLGPLGPSGDHLGNGFDEVIGFITDPDLPECADRSVSSKRVPPTQFLRKVVVGKNKISKKSWEKTKHG